MIQCPTTCLSTYAFPYIRTPAHTDIIRHQCAACCAEIDTNHWALQTNSTPSDPKQWTYALFTP